jgi:8-hydroxy-5-deazaflavin:NADPH oxidoreductase
MRIGVIGAGKIGGTVAKRLVDAGHEVKIANSRGPDTLKDLAGDIGATAATAEEAARDADLVIEAVPLKAFADLPGSALRGKVLVDAANYYPTRDGHLEELDDDAITSSALLQRDLPDARVVKALNTIFWEHLRDRGKPSGDPERLAIPIAGDDEQAKQTVSDLIDQIGFDPVDGGSLDDSRRQQPGTPVYGAPENAAKVAELLTQA